MAATRDPGAEQRRLLPTDGVPRADRYGLPSTRPWWLTTSVIVAALVCVTALVLGAWGGVVVLARAERLDEVQTFLASFDETRVGGAIVTLIGAVVLYVKLNASQVFARYAAERAGNAEAHVGRVLPQRLDHLEQVVASHTPPGGMPAVAEPSSAGSFSVVAAQSPPSAAELPAELPYPQPAPPTAQPEPRNRRRLAPLAPEQVSASPVAPWATTRTGPVPTVPAPGETAPMGVMPWDKPSRP